MNIVICSGRLTRNAAIVGNGKKVMRFTVAAPYGYDKEKKKARVEYVPCVLFSPSEKQEKFLGNEGKGTYVEVMGRISTSSYEKEGRKHYSTEVIVDKSAFKIITK